MNPIDADAHCVNSIYGVNKSVDVHDVISLDDFNKRANLHVVDSIYDVNNSADVHHQYN